jgi:hypothetical protein
MIVEDGDAVPVEVVPDRLRERGRVDEEGAVS